MTAGAYARRHLPPQLIMWLQRKRKARQANKRAQLRHELVAKHGAFTAAQLVLFCRDAGIQENGVLFVHCSYNDLLTYDGSPYELLSALRELVGPQGTLLMPAYTTNMHETPCRPFDVRRESTYTGIIPELFRREEGVLRSLHPRHSICGLGPRAAELLDGHEKCIYADGPDSPFDRIRKLNAQALCLGLPPGFNSFIHWVEDIEPAKYPIKVHEGPFDCVLRNAEGQEIRKPFYRRRAGRRNQEPLIGKSLGPKALHQVNFHGVSLCIYAWPALADELLALRDRGIVHYM